MMQQQMNQSQLLQWINQVSFAVTDIVLYLDTHPCDDEALAYYKKYSKLREEAVKNYEKLFGPLTTDGVNSDDKWTWVEWPWPWEGGKC